jgi:hypothetical protein
MREYNGTSLHLIKCDIDLRFHYEARLILFYKFMDTIKQHNTTHIFKIDG